MATYKLIVVSPFNDYRRGDEITDQSIVNNILNPAHEHHHHEVSVRKVHWTPPVQEVITPVHEEVVHHHESVIPSHDLEQSHDFDLSMEG